MPPRLAPTLTRLTSLACLALAPAAWPRATLHAQQAAQGSSSQSASKAKRAPTRKPPAKRATRTSAKSATAKRPSATKHPSAKATAGGAAKPRAKAPPAFASLWPVKGPAPLPGSILPHKRIVAYYGNPLSRRMGVLGEYDVDEMLRRLDREVAAWERADTLTPVVPALHLIATVAQGSPGRDGKWRTRMSDSLIERVYQWAQRRNALLFLDVQVAKSTLQAELPPLAHFLARPNLHLGIDPEFSMKSGHAPGKRIGTYDARDVNYAIDFLANLVDQYKLPPKVLVVHRFTRPMLTNSSKIRLDPRVQVVIHMDGWGSPSLKKGSYDSYVASEPVQFTGFKLFYKNDVRKAGWRMMKPAEILALIPKPVYIQYQ
ncbi:MAG TPA: hypothetical protein PKC83_16795 [Gemmatimonadaceae bacterium]|nr:hypothetical protein [Gemmatimonadaceae bacterium]